MKQTSYYILAGVRVSACAIDPLATCCGADPIKAPCKGVISIFFSGREDVRHVLIIDSRKYCDIQCPRYCEKVSPWLHLASLRLRGGIGWRLSEGDSQAEGSEAPGCALTGNSAVLGSPPGRTKSYSSINNNNINHREKISGLPINCEEPSGLLGSC